MRRKKNPPRGTRKNVRITIYPKTGRNAGRATSKKRKHLVAKQEGSSIGTTSPMQAETLEIKLAKLHQNYWQEIGEINKIAQQRIDQVVRSGAAEIERVAPKIIRDTIEEVSKTPFRLLSNLGKKQFQRIKRKLFK